MWLIFDGGFVSVVSKPGEEGLCVRARRAGDLKAMRVFCPELSPVSVSSETDYPVRAWVPREALARAVARVAMSIDYGNFKARVASRQGEARAAIYGDVWAALRRLEAEERTQGNPRRRAVPRKRRPGGSRGAGEGESG